MPLQTRFFPMEVIQGVWTVHMPVGAKVLMVEHRDISVGLIALADTQMVPRSYSLYIIPDGVDVPNDARYLGSYRRVNDYIYHVYSKFFNLKL